MSHRPTRRYTPEALAAIRYRVEETNEPKSSIAQDLAISTKTVPLKEVHATRGKYLRAEPVAALYEQGRAKHVGCFPLLEDEMCDFGFDGLSSGRSPDRLDALGCAVTALTGTARSGPRIRLLGGDDRLVPSWIFGRRD